MALTKTQKKKIIEDLKDKIGKQKIMVFVDFTGLKVKDFSNLRQALKKAGSEIKVAKKTLMDLVLKEKKIEIKAKKLVGEIALVFGYQDEISGPKAVYQFSKNHPNLKILGGIFENKAQDSAQILTLAQLPSKEELVAKLFSPARFPSMFYSMLQRKLGILNPVRSYGIYCEAKNTN